MIDINKKYTTQDGVKVRLYEAEGEYVYGRIEGYSYSCTWERRYGNICGGFSRNYNLIPAKREWWVSGYKNKHLSGPPYIHGFDTKDEALEYAKEFKDNGHTVIFRAVKITEGEGLDDD